MFIICDKNQHIQWVGGSELCVKSTGLGGLLTAVRVYVASLSETSQSVKCRMPWQFFLDYCGPE